MVNVRNGIVLCLINHTVTLTVHCTKKRLDVTYYLCIVRTLYSNSYMQYSNAVQNVVTAFFVVTCIIRI